MQYKDRRKGIEAGFITGWLRERASIVLLLCCLSVVLWLVAFAAFEVMHESDTWGAYKLNANLLNIGKVLVSAATIGCAVWRRLSIALPLITWVIALLLLLLLTSVTATAEFKLRMIVSDNPYYEMKERTTLFVYYSIVQILGIVFASKPSGTKSTPQAKH